MAWYEVTHKCGHTKRHQLYGPGSSREWRISKFEEELCEDCYAAHLAEENAKAAAENLENGLPSLKGSEKQVSWAETIRKKILDSLEPLYKEVDEEATPEEKNLFEAAINLLMSKESASWWIDRRSRYIENIVEECAGEAHTRIAPALPTTETEIEAKGEATIRPENPETETVAEFAIADKDIFVDFPEKLESFRAIMKAHIFAWTGSRWKRTPGKFAGSIDDRTAQTACALLDSGFIVRVYDGDIRKKILDRSFTPEQKCWVTSLKDKDTFSVKWPYEMDYFSQVKMIPGARWDSKRREMVIPAAQYEQVLDFAEVNGFSVSEGAQALSEKTMEIRDRAILATQAPVKEDGEIDPLTIPEGGFTIDESLRDDH